MPIPTRASALFANRPAANTMMGGRFYATDTQAIYSSLGNTWVAGFQLDNTDIVGAIGDILANRPNPQTCIGWLFIDTGTGNQYEAFPTAWAAVTLLVGGAAPTANPVFTGGITLTAPALFKESFQDNITAFAGGGQANAVALLNEINRITTVATRGDSVKLPASAPGLTVCIINAGTLACTVFPATGDAINGLAANVGVLQMPSSVDFYSCSTTGFWYAEVGAGFSGPMVTELAEDTITAFAGGGQTNARLLTSQTSRITIVTTAGDSIKLPPSAPGLELLIINHGANAMQVFGSGTDTIDDIATATGVSQMQNSMVIYSCATAGSWYSNGLATGFGGPGLQTVSTTNGITAHAGGGQASAVPLITMVNRVTTVATAADSVLLPAFAIGLQITVINAAASNSMNVFPAVGDQINVLGANAAFAVAAGKTVIFYCTNANQWHTILSA